MTARIAYRDEYPWVRCSCGYILGHKTVGCPDCGGEVEYENIEFLDRFAPTHKTLVLLADGTEHYAVAHPVDVDGQEYRPVPYEDRFRRRV